MKNIFTWLIVCSLLMLFAVGCTKEKKYDFSPSNEVGAINKEIKRLADSSAFIASDNKNKVELLKILFDSIAEDGVEQFPYSLIYKDSVVCHDNKIRVKYRSPEYYYVFIVSDNHIYQVQYDDPDSWENENSQYTLSYIYSFNNGG